MSSTTNGMCGTEGPRLAERLDIQPFQGWGVGPTPTQGCAPLALGFGILCRVPDYAELGGRAAGTPGKSRPSARHNLQLRVSPLRRL